MSVKHTNPPRYRRRNGSPRRRTASEVTTAPTPPAARTSPNPAAPPATLQAIGQHAAEQEEADLRHAERDADDGSAVGVFVIEKTSHARATT
jgi:hypothetical protein